MQVCRLSVTSFGISDAEGISIRHTLRLAGWQRRYRAGSVDPDVFIEVLSR
jgi:hypothetical protein